MSRVSTERLRGAWRAASCDALQEIVAGNPSWRVRNAWPYGDPYVLEQLWQRLRIGAVIHEVRGGRKFDFDVAAAGEDRVAFTQEWTQAAARLPPGAASHPGTRRADPCSRGFSSESPSRA